jgi:hypothetical protein
MHTDQSNQRVEKSLDATTSGKESMQHERRDLGKHESMSGVWNWSSGLGKKRFKPVVVC